MPAPRKGGGNLEIMHIRSGRWVFGAMALAAVVARAQVLTDPRLAVEVAASGLVLPTSMAFLAPDDVLVLQKNDGRVRRVVGGVLQPGAVLDLAVDGFNERGLHPDRRGFGIGVAGFPEGHPATPNRLLEMDYLKAKVDAGADYIVTQLFFDNRDFYDFRERCELAGIKVPIVAGIMPIGSRKGMITMAEMALGARYPAKLLRAVERVSGDDVAKLGVHWATEQCLDLLENKVRGIHFYTLNKSDATRQIYENLGLNAPAQTGAA